MQDLTGLTGKYDIDLTWAPDQTFTPADGAAAANLPDAPTADVFTAVRNSLGLKLEPEKLPVDILVIDHIERTPTEN